MLIKTYQKYLIQTFISQLLQITFVFFSLIVILNLFLIFKMIFQIPTSLSVIDV